MAVKQYIVGRGSAFVAKLTNGVPGPFMPLSNLKSFSFGLSVELGEHYENESAQTLLDASWTKRKSGKIDTELENVNIDNAKLLFSANVNDVAASTATAEVVSTTALVVGSVITLKRGVVSSVVIKDSTATPKTLVAGTNYALRDGGMFGSADVLDVTTGGPFTPPFKADYSYGAQSRATLLTADSNEYVLRFEGVSKATNQRVLYEFWRAKFSPADKLDLIGDDVAAPKVTISLLADTSRLDDSEFGPFGRMTYLGAPA